MKIGKRILSLVLLCGMLLSMLPTTFATKAENADPVVIQATDPSVSEITQSEFVNGTWNIDGRFRQIRPTLSKGAYWDPTKANSYNKVITGEGYFATPRFSKNQLPIGSVIVVEAGWQYSPEGWVNDVQQSSRVAATSQRFVQVTSEWWGNYTARAFNISKIDGTSVTDLLESDIHEAFRIYLPDEYIAKGYERFLPKMERCAYWSAVNNRIYTVNSSNTALNYYMTQRFHRSNLPVGSVVVFEKGYQVQQQAWLANEPQSTEQPFTTTNVIEITEEWWGDYTLRSFNIMKTTPSDMTNYTTEDMHSIFRIYVPKKTLSIEGLPHEQTNAETKIHQLPSMTPLDDDYEKMMSYIIQTRGGKIIVIDGGCPTNDLDGNYLFSYLQRITGSKTPHVDAWFITHMHTDHFGAFLSVAARHSKEITVDALYHRFPTYEECAKYLYDYDQATYQKYYGKMISHAEKLKTSTGETTPLISVNSRHSGKCNSMFDFDEVHIDILLTVEDVYWGADNISGKFVGNLEDNAKVYNMTVAKMLSYNMNETSLVLRATFSGKTVLFLGDGTTATEIMLKKYHKENATDSTKYFNLKSDIVQVSHHGVQAMGSEIYDLINPDAALWCIPYKMYASRPGDYLTTYYVRQWFKRLATTNYVAFDGVDVLSCPPVRSASAVSIPAELKPYVFNAQYYANRYPDLKEAYGTDETKLYKHFVNYGIEEGRCASPFFDVRFYMNNNSQNFQETMKGNYEKAFKDFITNYKSTAYMKLSESFDPAYYVSNHKDLAGSTQFALLRHYATNGYLTGEQASRIYLSKEGHTYHTDYAVTPAKAPTCTSTGLTQGAKCNGCGEVLVAQETIPVLGHDYQSVGAQIGCEESTSIPDTAFFANFTGNAGRYSNGSVYSGVNYDLGSNWSYLSERYLAPTVDTEAGTLSTGIHLENTSHIWIQTGPSYNEGFNLNYQPQKGDIIQIRVKFDGLKVLTGQTAAKVQAIYFIGPDRFEGLGGAEKKYGLDTYTFSPDLLDADGFVTISYPVKGIDSAAHTTMTCLRFQLSNLENIDMANPGTITLDYIYVGPADAKIATYVCDRCGISNTTEPGTALGHTETIHEGVDPTCTETGLSQWKDCSVCGTVLEAQTVLPAAGHVEAIRSGVAPTCTKTGLTEGKYCATCGVVLVEQTVVPATGHRETVIPAVAPTCTTAGKTQGEQCISCGLVYVPQETIPATGHSYELIDTIPDCETGTYIPDTAFFANFTGTSDRYSKNSLYSGVNYDLASNWSLLTSRYKRPVVDTGAGTLTTGFIGDEYNHLWIQTGASYNTGFNLNYRPEDGHIIKLRMKFDGLTLKSGVSAAKVQLHYFTGVDRYEGTGTGPERLYSMGPCTITGAQLSSNGYVTLSYPVSRVDFSAVTNITALRLQFSDLQNINNAEPGTITLDYLYIGPKDAQLVTYGCNACGDGYTLDVVEPLGHSYGSAVTPPTCVAQGYTTHTCTTCGSTYKDSFVPATGHTEVTDPAKAPTCTATGLTAGKHCDLCKATLIPQEVIPAKGHRIVTDQAVAPTCTESGLTEGKHCSVCSAILTVQAVIPPTGHTYETDITEATCTTPGIGIYTCACGDSYTEELPALSHKTTYVPMIPPTCSEAGQKEHYLCDRCGMIFADEACEYPLPEWYLPIESFGHLCQHLVTEPTCTKKGFTTYICACGESYISDEVEALGHAPLYAPTNGEKHIVTCENCDLDEEAPHSYEDGLCICGHVEVKEPVEESTWKLGHSLNLASDISINYAIGRSTLAGYDLDSIYILAEIDSYKEGKYSLKEVKLLPVVNGSYYYFTLTGMTAVNMNDEIRAVLYGTKDGQVHYSPIDTYSVASYAYAQLGKATAAQKLKVLCAELLRYGAKAQIFKSYRLDALVDAKMTEEQKALLSDMEAVTFGNTNLTENIPGTNTVQWLGKSLDLASKVSVKFIFSLGSYTDNTEDLTMKVTYKDINGKDKEKIITDIEVYNASRGYYAFTLDSLLAAELRSVLTVQILSGDTVVSGTLQYAADTYGNGKTGTLGDLCKALFAYSDSAKAYFQ